MTAPGSDRAPSGLLTCGVCGGHGYLKCPTCGGQDDLGCDDCQGGLTVECDPCDGTGYLFEEDHSHG